MSISGSRYTMATNVSSRCSRETSLAPPIWHFWIPMVYHMLEVCMLRTLYGNRAMFRLMLVVWYEITSCHRVLLSYHVQQNPLTVSLLNMVGIVSSPWCTQRNQVLSTGDYWCRNGDDWMLNTSISYRQHALLCPGCGIFFRWTNEILICRCDGY